MFNNNKLSGQNLLELEIAQSKLLKGKKVIYTKKEVGETDNLILKSEYNSYRKVKV